jgi:hypothetical protein
MAFKLISSEDGVLSQAANITEGLGFPLRPVEGPVGSTFIPPFLTILQSESHNDQTPTLLDTPQNVVFGSPVSTSYLTLDSNGVVTFLQPMMVSIRFRIAAGRDSNPGIVHLAARASLDGNVAGTVAILLDNQNVTVPLTFEVNTPVLPGMELFAEFYRDSLGSNSGGLVAEPTTLWGSAPSAQITIFRIAGLA